MQAAVGHLCPSCVTWERNPVGQVSTSRLLLALAAGMGAGIALGVGVAVLSDIFSGFFSVIMWMVAGFLIGQAVHTAANKSHAPALRFVAGGSALVSWGVALLLGGGIVIGLAWILFALLQLAVVIVLAIAPFR